jgi:uncharacterized protein (TIGR02099 family)
MSSIPPATTSSTVTAVSGTARGPSLRWKVLRWLGQIVAGVVVAAWSLLLIAWLTLHWGILPHIQQWRQPIEERAGRALGATLSIGQIRVRSSGWVPSFELEDVQLLDADRRPALRLPRVFAALSPRSLLSFEPRFEQLLIDGPELEVRRDRVGRIYVGGLEVSGGEASDGHAAADWFFAQTEFVIRGGGLRWTDEQRGAAPLSLSNVQLRVRNGLRSHDLRIAATPPADWGTRFNAVARFTQPLLARHGDWQRWVGTVYVDLPDADVHALHEHVTLPFDLREGVGAVRGWIEVDRGRPVAATFDVALRSVWAQLAANVEPLRISELEGRLNVRHSDEGGALALQHFTFLTGDELRWPQGDLSLVWRQRPGRAVSGGELSAQRLDLALLARVGSRVPFGEAVRGLLTDLDPKGTVSDLNLKWDGPPDAPQHYRARGTLSALAIAARPAAVGVGRPGLRGANVQFDATDMGGHASLAINGGALELPGVFDDPVLVLDQFAAQAQWTIDAAKPADAPAALALKLSEVRFANADAQGEMSARWSTGDGSGAARAGRFPGYLELDARVSNAVAHRTYRYLPSAIPQSVRQYLENAVQSGRIAQASFHVKGDLAQFPYFGARAAARGPKGPAREGEFRINGRVEDLTFAFVPSTAASGTAAAFESPWPALSKASVEINLDRGAFELRNGRAVVGNVDFGKIDGAIRSLDSEAVLTLDGSARGPLAEMLRFVNTTPVGAWTGKALDAATASGNADLALGLTIPLKRIESTTVKGSVALAGNDLRITADSPMLAGARGRVEFTQRGFALVGTSASLYGGDAVLSGGTVRLNAEGTINADGLRRAAALGSLTRLAGALGGQTSYRASLALGRGQKEVAVTSNLVGLSSSLPSPLGKAAETPLAMRVQNSVDPGSLEAGQTPRDTLRLELGNVVQVQYLRDLSGAAPRVLRGGIGVMEPAPQPAAGVAAAINLNRLVIDEWDAAADRYFGTGDGRDAAGASGYVPDTVALRVQELVAGPRRLTNLSAGLSQDGGVWRANLDADQLDGYVEYRPPQRRGAAAAGRVFARLSRLSVPKSEVEQVETLLDQQPSSIPALDVVVDDFELRGKRLGRVEIEATNRSTGQGREVVRDWQLSKLKLTTPEAQFSATGHWAAAPGTAARGATAPPRRAVMDFTLQVADGGGLLDRLGTQKAVRGGKGQLSGQVGWLGSPFTIDYPSLSGQLKVAIDAGQFLKVDPGAARLLGVLSLQSLPRRLSLDFRDVFQEGFAFDSITGDVKITQGVAQTNNLRMRGVQALVLMEGSADIGHETQDLRVVVVPEISAATAALAYAVINPAIGLGAFLAQTLLKKPLSEAGTREFHVSGPWSDPKVERVARKFGDDVPSAADAPASAASTN